MNFVLPNGVITAAYIIASVFFILSLGGLSHQESARRGNWFGIIGMTIVIHVFIQQIGPAITIAVTWRCAAIQRIRIQLRFQIVANAVTISIFIAVITNTITICV